MELDKFWVKRSWLQRWAAREVSRMIMNARYEHHIHDPILDNPMPKRTYQMSGKLNWLIGEKEANIQVPDTQIVHWILREAGYNVCEMDVIDGWAP